MKHLNLSTSRPSVGKRGRLTSASRIVAFVLMLMASNETFGQTASLQRQDELVREKQALLTYSHLVSGLVKDEKGDPMVGVSIYLKGTTEGTTTNAEGRFTFPRPLEAGERLTISFIGYESIEYVVEGTLDENIVVVMNVDVIIWGDLASDEVYTTKPGLRRFFKKLF